MEISHKNNTCITTHELISISGLICEVFMITHVDELEIIIKQFQHI